MKFRPRKLAIVLAFFDAVDHLGNTARVLSVLVLHTVSDNVRAANAIIIAANPNLAVLLQFFISYKFKFTSLDIFVVRNPIIQSFNCRFC